MSWGHCSLSRGWVHSSFQSQEHSSCHWVSWLSGPYYYYYDRTRSNAGALAARARKLVLLYRLY